jgi:UDP-N-acetylmuramoyl-L-alanyl-D-glutamate--2,6-diaminopimelate ligase
MLVNDVQVHFRLIGEFNAYNLLAVFGAACSLGEDPAEVLTQLSALTGAEGRFDYQVSASGIIGIVDYAHTPDAVENVLTTIRQLRRGNESIITVVGCGGDRDKTKRPVMAKIAVQYSNKVILTSDNPRTEDPAEILQDMQRGLEAADARKYLTVSDRKEAIKTAVSIANAGDIILVAGKGHEKYQEIKGVKHPFDDKQVLVETFQLLNK